MNHGIADEVQKLFNALMWMLEDGDLEGITKVLPLCSNTLTPEQTENIRHTLQERLPVIARGAVPVVSIGRAHDDDQAGDLHVHFLKRYLAEDTPQGWFVDAEGEPCWYFKVADERSAVNLAKFFNQPEYRRQLEALRFGVGVEESSLSLWLLGLRDSQVGVLKFGYKSTGQFQQVDHEMFDLNQ
ncbi:hypothetical protein [Pseudomonas monteilii]|uniref:hypothetical protein n=1 Tax=Pseudomonas monteilii TaxID=76759 RepID=UPI001E398B76|nr:hypothetical protein [Pseudomonas monteilii]WJO30995.1 hypothetical protein LU690_18135 [Pseudomonas monteilii]